MDGFATIGGLLLMSETAYERGYRNATEGSAPAQQTPGAHVPSRNASPLSRRYGPLPAWAWMVLAFVLLLGVAYWRSRNNANTAAGSSAGTTATNDIPQFVNQVYTNPAPPEEPGPTGPKGPPGPPGKSGTPAPKPKVPVNVASFRYTVKKGDTLLSLSQKFLGTTNRTLLAHANGLGTGAGLRAGQVIIIPSHKSPPGAPAPVSGVNKGPGGTSGGSSSGGGEGED